MRLGWLHALPIFAELPAVPQGWQSPARQGELGCFQPLPAVIAPSQAGIVSLPN